jgi:hypothetical protein
MAGLEVCEIKLSLLRIYFNNQVLRIYFNNQVVS